MYVAHIHAHKHLKTLKTLKTLKVAWVNRQGHFTVVFQNKNNDIYIYMLIWWHKARLRTANKPSLDKNILNIYIIYGPIYFLS